MRFELGAREDVIFGDVEGKEGKTEWAGEMGRVGR